MTASAEWTKAAEAADVLQQLTLCSEALRAARTVRALTLPRALGVVVVMQIVLIIIAAVQLNHG